MGVWTVSCESCDLSWVRAGGGVSDYERQAIESRPCPCCGAYTLACPEPGPAAPARRKNRTRAQDGRGSGRAAA